MPFIEIDGYAAWASALINGDRSGLSDEDCAELDGWLQYHNLSAHDCLSCEDESFFGWPDGPGCTVKGLLVTYSFVCR